ncbi:MAG: hypothetical protein P8M22_09985 [Phycisphaerales bacterium]|nr:hypothetical protein [Phycisphaerales bacterium]
MKSVMLSMGGLLGFAMAGLASADLVTVEWDISSESYNGESVSLYGLQQEPAWADALLVSWGYEDVEADIYWNEGASFSNWASEVRLGISDIDLGDTEGDAYFWVAAPFPDQFGADEPGSFYHATGGNFDSGDISGLGYTLGSEGDIAAAAYSTWADGTGLSSGLFTSGTVWVTFETVPSPGGLAIIGLAGFCRRGRRRH